MNVLRFLLLRSTYKKVVSKSSLLFLNNTKKSIESYQIKKFNAIWKDAFVEIPFYRKWKEENNLPDSIKSLSELNQWPILTKKGIIEHMDLVRRDLPPRGVVITSGSTGVPLKLPVWHDEETQSNMWIGRAANGLMPDSKTFLIWGHHHLHGEGFKRVINIIIRNIKDHILNYKRISAYDTSIEAMHKALHKFEQFKPDFVIGYSSSVLSFLRCNKDSRLKNHPKLVLCTAGPLSSKEKDEIRTYFQCPLCMEYGSVECGVMAYSVDDCSYYKTFWNSHILQGVKEENGNIRNIVTKISKNYFPLIRYDIGDYLELPEGEDLSSILNISTIVGRPTDIISLSNGTSFFAMLIEACVKHLDGIISHQLVVRNNIDLEILIVDSHKLSEQEYESVRSKLYNVVPALKNNNVAITQVDELLKNKGGKTPIVIRK